MNRLSKCLVLVLTIFVIAQLSLVKADPYVLNGFVPPDSLTKPPNVQVNSPLNNSVITSNNVSLSFHVTKPVSPKASQTVISYVYYEADWLKETTFLYNYENPEVINGKIVYTGYIKTYDYSYNFSNMPDGNHSIIVHADGMGWYPPSDGLHYNGFLINGTSTILFAIDSNPPKVSVSIQNESSSNQLLNISVNKKVSTILYSLDGQNNSTTNGNITLSGLTNGKHNVTVYVEDQFGLMDRAETSFFVFTKEQDTVNNSYVIIAVILVSIIIGSLLLYRHRKTANLKQ